MVLWQRIHFRDKGESSVTRFDDFAKPSFSCIDRAAAFAQPTLDLICEHTGMVGYMCFGGPEPGDGGRLNIIRFVAVFFHFY